MLKLLSIHMFCCLWIHKIIHIHKTWVILSWLTLQTFQDGEWLSSLFPPWQYGVGEKTARHATPSRITLAMFVRALSSYDLQVTTTSWTYTLGSMDNKNCESSNADLNTLQNDLCWKWNIAGWDMLVYAMCYHVVVSATWTKALTWDFFSRQDYLCSRQMSWLSHGVTLKVSISGLSF